MRLPALMVLAAGTFGVLFNLTDATSNDGFCVDGVCERSGMAAIVMTAKLNMIFALRCVIFLRSHAFCCCTVLRRPYVDLMVAPSNSDCSNSAYPPLASQDPSCGATRVVALALHRYV